MTDTRARWPCLGAWLATLAATACAQELQRPPQPVAPPVSQPASPAVAQPASQQQPPKLASVTIINVVSDVARNIGVDASQVPLNVQVPMDVAASVCGIGIDVLTQQAARGVAQCTAQSTTRALDEWVQRQVQGNAQK